MESLLPLPPPYEAWLTISSDPDDTGAADWQELHQVIWEELGLRFADSVFMRNVNATVPDQVSAETHPSILEAHPIDTLHTWGDYILSEREVFRRERAEEAVEILERIGLEPRVWIDHSFFHGNLMKAPRLGGLPEIRDASGNGYANPFYSLDLAHRAGVRYVWDGWIRRALIGPRRRLSRGDYYAARNGKAMAGRILGALDWLGKPLWRWLSTERFDYEAEKTRLYYPVVFPDGRSLYAFWRYGSWDLADIGGLAELIDPQQIDEMVARQASCIVYSHLGKRSVRARNDDRHIPDRTRAALESVRDRYERKELMVSPTSELLDYNVIRDHSVVTAERVEFRSDTIRFRPLTPGDLSSHVFGVAISAARHAGNLEVSCDGIPVDFSIVDDAGGVLSFRVEPVDQTGEGGSNSDFDEAQRSCAS